MERVDNPDYNDYRMVPGDPQESARRRYYEALSAKQKAMSAIEHGVMSRMHEIVSLGLPFDREEAEAALRAGFQTILRYVDVEMRKAGL